MSEDFFAEDGDSHRPERQLAWRNRRVLSWRLRWPEDALEVCEQIETEHPDWAIFYCAQNTTRGFERPAGYSAVRRVGICLDRVHLFDADPAALLERIKLTAPPRGVTGY